MKTEFVLLGSAILTAMLFPMDGSWAADPVIFRNQDELIVQFGHLDRWREKHPQLEATLRLTGAGGEKLLAIDLANRLTPEAIVVDLAGYGVCAEVALTVKDGAGRTIHAQQVRPIPMVTLCTSRTARRSPQRWRPSRRAAVYCAIANPSRRGSCVT